MPKDALTQDDIDALDGLLHGHDDRTAFYLHYYELTGNKTALEMAKISHFSDWVGAVAKDANEQVQVEYPDLYPKGEINPADYPTGGVHVFSEQVAESLFQNIKQDFTAATHTGVLTDQQVLEAAREAWDANHLGEQFPGNLKLAWESYLDRDLVGMNNAFWSEGSLVAVKAAWDATFTGDHLNDTGFQERIANDSFHITEDGKVGFYVNKDTGHIDAVVDYREFPMPSKAEWATGIDLHHQPPVESQGVLNSLPPLPTQETPFDPEITHGVEHPVHSPIEVYFPNLGEMAPDSNRAPEIQLPELQNQHEPPVIQYEPHAVPDDRSQLIPSENVEQSYGQFLHSPYFAVENPAPTFQPVDYQYEQPPVTHSEYAPTHEAVKESYFDNIMESPSPIVAHISSAINNISEQVHNLFSPTPPPTAEAVPSASSTQSWFESIPSILTPEPTMPGPAEPNTHSWFGNALSILDPLPGPVQSQDSTSSATHQSSWFASGPDSSSATTHHSGWFDSGSDNAVSHSHDTASDNSASGHASDAGHSAPSHHADTDPSVGHMGADLG